MSLSKTLRESQNGLKVDWYVVGQLLQYLSSPPPTPQRQTLCAGMPPEPVGYED